MIKIYCGTCGKRLIDMVPRKSGAFGLKPRQGVKLTVIFTEDDDWAFTTVCWCRGERHEPLADRLVGGLDATQENFAERHYTLHGAALIEAWKRFGSENLGVLKLR